MVRCVLCPNFTRKTCYCKYYNRIIKPDDIHKQISCEGYPNFARRKWLLNATHKEENPEVEALLVYQILGDNKE